MGLHTFFLFSGLQSRKEERSSTTTYQYSYVLLGLDLDHTISNADAPCGFQLEHPWGCSTETIR